MNGGAPHVVILGGGFAGLHAGLGLRSAPARVTLNDRRNHHLFFPLLYQVATAGLNPSDIARPIRRVLVCAESRTVDTPRPLCPEPATPDWSSV